ncbi:Transmembrane protein of unknown function [Modestobacter sp. DSM 44400]|uniref:DUF3566 domain-containing protein n=1 Tax=Modestobacter sp. DSM 44400 TaxID=1550230 RepID=UPI0008985D84|nr:DUF3566 domain-containing protein [Modestobacter sp. DSM 44400]SDY23535.1 Transmembrane protein of unknown function [Modestobacter sp. DSM 44400]
MSDRTRGSVRTGSREGDGAAGGLPEAAIPGDGDGGATTAGPAAKTPKAAPAAEAARGAAPQPSVDGTQVITPDSPPSGVFAGAAPAPSSPPAADGNASARTVAPSSPLVPPPGAPAGRASGSAAGAGWSPGARGQAPVPPAAPVGPEGTQAVPLPAAGSRPAGASGRPPGSGAGSPSTPTATTPKEHGRGRGVSRGPRRARLQLRHIDTWSALKISLVVSIALFFVWMVAVGLLFGVLNGLGVFQTLNDLFGQLGSVSGGDGGNSEVITAGVVFGGAAVLGAINVVLLTALCTVGAVVYNLCSDLVGGLEVTLAERE